MTAADAVKTILDYADAFGYHYRTAKDNDNVVWFKNRINIANFLSYIPIIRIGVGVWRIYSHIPLITDSRATADSERMGYGMIARGVAEILLPDGGLSIMLLLLPDIAMTALRHFAHTRPRA